MTGSDYNTGTDRVASLVEDYNYSTYVNVQGDEPLVKPIVAAKTLVPSGSPKGSMNKSPFSETIIFLCGRLAFCTSNKNSTRYGAHIGSTYRWWFHCLD